VRKFETPTPDTGSRARLNDHNDCFSANLSERAAAQEALGLAELTHDPKNNRMRAL
jgi:hypothetical protein